MIQILLTKNHAIPIDHKINLSSIDFKHILCPMDL